MLLHAFDNIEKTLTPAQIHQYITTGSLDRALGNASIDQMFEGARAATRDSMRAAFDYYRRDLPGGPTRGGLPAVTFDVLSPRVVEAVRSIDTRVFTTLKDDVREVFRLYVEDGLQRGLGPVAMSRGLVDVLGLAPNQFKAISNFERLLRDGSREALTRALRDRRFDKTLERTLGPGATDELKDSQITRMVDKYRANMEAFNAETNARTAALDSFKWGQNLMWSEAVDNGVVDGDRLMKRWVGVKDDREREEHLAMEGEEVPYDEPFSNGEMVPGDSTYNCRCIAIYFLSAQ